MNFARTEGVLRAACGEEFTGAVARVEYRGSLLYESAFGSTRTDRYAKPIYVDTQFDLASLTKIVVTTLLLECVARGELELDGSLLDWFPEWRGSTHESITLRMLLAHTAGLNSGADFRMLRDERVESYALSRELVDEPGRSVLYSDLGYIVLGMLLARVRGASLEAILAAAIPHRRLCFRPAAIERSAIPATEDDGWRGRVQGFVHDEKAYLMGGTAGHAGLFGSAADVAFITQMFLGPLCGRPPSLIPLDLVRAATSLAADDPVLRRGLGWALKTSDLNSCGAAFARTSFGHTGFVGTCVWADPQRDLIGVLLTNTLYFGRRDTSALRSAFYDAIVGDIEAVAW